MVTSRRAHTSEVSLWLPPSVSLPPQRATAPGGPSRPAGRSGPRYYGVTALPCVPVHVKPCVHPLRVESLVCPSLVALLHPSPATLKRPDTLGAPPPDARPPGWSLMWDSELTLVQKSLPYNFLVYGLPTQQVWILIRSRKCPSYFLIVVSSLSLGIEYFLVVTLVFSQEEVSSSPSTPSSCLVKPLLFILEA